MKGYAIVVQEKEMGMDDNLTWVENTHYNTQWAEFYYNEQLAQVRLRQLEEDSFVKPLLDDGELKIVEAELNIL